MTDRLTLLQTFLRISERGSISAAARNLNLSQASASRQLAQLEDRLGTPLIVRTTHALSLTEAGEQLLPDARALLQGWDQLADRTRADEGPLAGPIRVIVPVALGQTILLPALIDFQQSHPDVSLTWLLEDEDIRFAETGCDVWINIGAPADETLISQSLIEVERLMIGTQAFIEVRQPEDLTEHPCIGLGPFEGSHLRLYHRTGETKAVSVSTRLTTNNILVSLNMVKAGLGYAIMPRWLVQGDLDSGDLLDLLPDWRAPRLPVTLNYAPATRDIKRMRAFRDAMADAVSSHMS